MPGQVIIGILAIAFGVVFLLDNLDFWDIGRYIHFWPTVFIVFGLLKIYDTRTPSGLVVGAVLVMVGITMTLKRLGLYYITWHNMWPVVLIGLGILVVAKAWTGRRGLSESGPEVVEDESILNITAILGGFKRRVMSQEFRGGEITAIMGGCDIDLRNSSFQGEAVLNVFAVCGGITVKVPADWTVVLNGTPILGGFDERTVAPPDSSKRLVVKGYAIMGGLEVRN